MRGSFAPYKMKEEPKHWAAICAQAEARIPHAYSSTFFSRRHISIVDQQARCFNLCWALTRTRRVTSKSHVAIVGGGISGLTSAVALAIWTDCIVYVFERSPVLLRRFREASHRYIHPDLNHLGGLDKGLNYDPHKDTDFPFMNWSGDYAPHFAEQLVRKFDHYRATTGIALYLGSEVNDVFAKTNTVGLAIDGLPTKTAMFDAVILATGFGDEKFDSHTNDTSYWHSGNPRHYRASPLRKPGSTEKILISGNGDSGVIELAHLLVENFSHEDIFRFLPANDLSAQLGDWYAKRVSALAHRKIDYDPGREIDPGPLGWYWTMREVLDLNPQLRAFGDSPEGRIAKKFYAVADSELKNYHPQAKISSLIRSRIERTLYAKLHALGSLEIKNWIEGIDLKKIFSKRIQDVFRKDVRVTVIGRTPTIYSPVQAPLNWFLLRVLSEYGAVTYHPAELRNSSLVRNRVKCELEAPTGRAWERTFDQVVTRHGPDFGGYSSSLMRLTATASSPYLAANHFNWTVAEFRNARLEGAKARAFPLTDSADGDPVEMKMASLRKQLSDADSALWMCIGSSSLPRANLLYRKFKREIDPTVRSKRVVGLLRIGYGGDSTSKAGNHDSVDG